MSNQTGKEKDFVLFPYNGSDERAIKIDFSGNAKLANGNKGTILGVKGTSKDGNTKYIRIFSQTGVMFKNDDGKFTGDITWSEIGAKKAIVGWLNDKSDKPNIAGYMNEPGVKKEKLPF
jgi:hypothetical protein